VIANYLRMEETSDGTGSREPQPSDSLVAQVTGGTNVLVWSDSEDSSSSASEFEFSGHEALTAFGAHDTAPHRLSYVMIGVFQTFSAAYREMTDQSDDVHTYETRYTTQRLVARVYRCRSHDDCEHRYKIKTINELDVSTQFLLERSGVHGAQRTTVSRRGVHPELRDEVDALLNMGWGAMQLRTMLNHRYRDQPRLLRMVPTSKQLENRKAFLVRSSANGWEISNHVTFTAWASNRVCSSRAQFMATEGTAGRRMDEMIVLDAFSFEGQEDGEGTSFGVVVTTRRVFRNVLSSVRDQPGSLLCATDGTYKLHFGGWTVVDCGSVALSWSRGKYVHRFIPWVYMFVRTESKAAYARMFEVVCDRARMFLGVEVQVSFGSLDHSDAIAAAFIEVWPEVTLITCWPHMARNARQKKTLLVNADMYAEMIRPGIDLLRSARTHKQFVKLATVITEHWVAQGEDAYANWFTEVYLAERWNRWHINGAGAAGVLPSQQGIESHHSVIKKTCVPSSRASTNGVLRGILPRFLRNDGENLCPERVAQFAEGPVPPEMMAKAEVLVGTERNYRLVHKGRGRHKRLEAVLFNVSKHIVGGQGILGADVDNERATKFLHSLNGRFPRGIEPAELEFELLSLHRVLVKQPNYPPPFQLLPIWPAASIERLRSFLQCSCEGFVRSGWVCSHVLAVLSLLGLLDLQAAMASVPVRRTPGRPPSRSSALTRESTEEGFYDVDRLVRLFLRRPGQPLQWRVVAELLVARAPSDETSSVIGEVIGLRLSDGVYKWSVRFGDGSVIDYEAQQLARAVHRAHNLRVRVTN